MFHDFLIILLFPYLGNFYVSTFSLLIADFTIKLCNSVTEHLCNHISLYIKWLDGYKLV